MRAVALLALLASLPGRAAETVTPAQARASVVAALPPDIARGAGQGDLRGYLERLSPEQKQAALRSLTAKEGELGDDPATLGVIGQAYAGLGRGRKLPHPMSLDPVRRSRGQALYCHNAAFNDARP